MVSIVLVSHSRELAEATAALGRQMAPDARVVAAGGLEDGGFGTSYERIEAAIGQVLGDDGVILIMDMGSSVMTARMVVEDLEDDRVHLADCPFVEGAVEAMVASQGGTSADDILEGLGRAARASKL